MGFWDSFSNLSSAFMGNTRWGNTNTNLGNPNRDSTAGTFIQRPVVLTRERLNSYYIQSWIIRRI
jgi:hypothetical protein